MAANLKIGIIADDGNAQKKFEGLSTSVDMTAKSVDQLRNMMAKLTVENLKLTNDIKSMQKGTQEYVQAVNELEHIQDVLARTTKQYDNAVQRLGLSYQTGTDSLKNYRQELKMLQSQYQKAMAQGQGTGFSSEDMQNLELLTSKIDTVTQKIKELEKAEKERAEIAAKNNSLAQFQNSIEQANIQGILQKEKALKELTAAIAKANLQQEQYNKNALANFQNSVEQADIQNILTKEKALKEFTLTLQKANLQQEQYDIKKSNEAAEAKRNSLLEVQNALEKAGIQNILTKEKALKDFTATLQKANLQQQQYNAQAVNNFSSGAMSTASGQTTEYLAQGLLGNTVNQLKSDYAAYYAQLLKVIALYGVESEEAQNLAQKLNTLDGQIKDLSTQTTATTKRIGNLIKNFVSAQMIVWAIRKAFTSITTTLKEASEAASEAEETYNLFITTFENASITAEQTASRLSNALGIANSTAQETLGTFGDLAAGYGATDKEALEFAETATEVAMDIVSYKNISGDLSTTMQSLSSGLAGNVENFRKLGYVMTQAEVKAKLQQKGLDKLTGSALQYAQIQARLEILQEKSVKAQGDMIKTLDSTENVTRRLNESWLEWKENLGSTVNVVLTPMKRWLNEILTISNKVTSAMKEINGGEFTVKVEQVATGEQLEKIVKNLFAKSNGSGSDFWRRVEEAVLGVSATDVSNVTGKEASDVALAVGTDIEKVIKIIDESSYFISEEEKKNARAIYQQEKADAEKRQKKEDAKNEAISAIQSAMSFIDNLNSINGVYGDDSSLSRRLANTQNGVVNITSLEGDTQTVVDNLLKNLSSASASSFVSALDIALGREDTESMLEAKLSSVEEVYEALWNEFYSSGEELTEWQKGALEETLELAKSLNGQIEDLNKEAERKKIADTGNEYLLSVLANNISSAMTATSSLLGDKDSYILQQTFQSFIDNINDVLENGLEETDTIGGFYKRTLKSLQQVLGNYNSPTASDFNSSDPYSFLADIQKATGENTLLDALEAQLSAAEEYYENVKTFYKADGVISEEEQTALNDILTMVTGIYEKKEEEANKEEPEPEAWEEYWQQIVDTVTEIYNFTKDSLRVLFEAPVMGAVKFVQGGVSGVKESKDNGEGILGNIWGFIKGSFSSVWDYIKQLFSDLLEPLVKFITESDAFQELMTVLSDSVLPAINAALEPFLPLLKMFAYFLQNVVLPILYELFPVIKAIAAVCGYVMAGIGAAITFVSDGIKWLVGNLVGWIEDMVNAIASLWGGGVDWGFDGWRNIDVWGNTTKVWKDMCGYVEEIKDCTMEIKDNTSEDEMDLTVLNKLFESGVIDWDEMNALRASFLGQTDPGKQTQLLASTAGDYATYLRSGGTSNISYGDVSIEINSESGDPEKIAKEVARVLEEWQRNGKKSFSVAIA